jgi:putative hemolysin
LAEVSRTTVLREHRGSAVLAKLWKCAYTYARRRGCSNFVALVQVGYTDSLVDATLIHDALLQQGMLHPRYELSMRHAAPAPSSPVCPLFSEAERSAPGRVRLPPVLRLFHRFGLRACGKPVFMPEVGRVGMAMLASPDTFSANTVQFFESPDPSIHLD